MFASGTGPCHDEGGQRRLPDVESVIEPGSIGPQEAVSMTKRQVLQIALATLAVLALAAAPAAAQAEGAGFGLKAGYLYNSLHFDEGQDVFDGRAGWMAGVFFGGNRGGRIGVMGEVNVLRKSALCDCNDDADDLYYLQVPVLLRVNLGSRSRSGVSVYGLAGPAIDVKIGERLTSNVIDEYEGLDVSIVGGLGIELTRVILEVRGTWGQRNIARDLGSSAEINSRTFSVLAGFRFN
jgi:hypothetical protein